MLNRIEGLGVDIHQARFTGIFDVTEEDDESLGLDNIVILLVAARSGQIQHTIRDSGDVVAKRILKVSDAVPLTGEAREEALRQLTNRADPNQGSFDWGMTPGALEAGATNRALSNSTTPTDGSTSQIPVSSASENNEKHQDDAAPEPDERPGGHRQEPEAPDIFVPRAFDPDLGEVEVVGQIRHDRKDTQLSKFLRESYQ